MRVAIYGCGAMGTVLGAFLNRAGQQTDLIDTYEEHVNKLNEAGAKLVGFEAFTQPVRALLPSQVEGIYDLIILLCKQTANKQVFEMIHPHINKASTILTLQNGFPEPSLVEAFGEERTLGGTILWGATFVEPGVSEVTEPISEKPVLYEIGSITGEINERVKLAAAALGKMGTTHISTNLIGSRWTKLVANSSMSGMSAALGCTFGNIMNNKKAMNLIGRIGAEAGLVCKAAGQSFAPYGGFKIDKLLKRGDWLTRILWMLGIKLGYKKLGTAKASMLQDLEKEKLTEVDMINGYICKLGKKYGVPTPTNDKVVEIIHGIEIGKYTLSINNINYFKD
jgi:2-dehydropantoate 2-reductase